MTLKLLQLNMYAGKKLHEIISFIQHESFDIVQLQEVAGGKFSQSGSDNFTELKEALQYSGENAPCLRMTNDPASYFGNATLYKPSLEVHRKEVIWLQPYKEFQEDPFTEEHLRTVPRNALALQVVNGSTSIWCINTHLAWGPTPDDENYKISQAEFLYPFLKSLHEPFILTGDFNVTSQSQIVQTMETLGSNQMAKLKVTNTLNPRLHRVASLFPAGLAVDYVFTSNSLMVTQVKLLETEDLSDHLGIAVEIEI